MFKYIAESTTLAFRFVNLDITNFFGLSKFQLCWRGIPLAASNWLLTAQFITAAALQRKESRGSQFRSDYPEAIKEWAHHSTLTLDDVEAISERALNFEHHDNSNVVKVAFAQ